MTARFQRRSKGAAVLLQGWFQKTTYVPFQQPRQAPPVDAPPTASNQLQTAPGTTIAHSPALVARLHSQHAWLQQSLEAIETDAISGDFVYAQRALKLFRRALMTHLLEEHVKMYTYVTRCLAHDAGATRSLLAMKAEMETAGNAAMGFADTYAQTELTAANQQTFITALETVRTTLADRIDWEEDSLYGLYLPPAAYK